MTNKDSQNPLININFPSRLIFYICVFMLMINISPVVDYFTHPEIPYFDEEHLMVGFVAGIVCIFLFVFLEIFFRYLKNAISKIRMLENYLSICANCKKIRIPGSDDKIQESWMPIESYISSKTATIFSHGMCPDCVAKLYPKKMFASKS